MTSPERCGILVANQISVQPSQRQLRGSRDRVQRICKLSVRVAEPDLCGAKTERIQVDHDLNLRSLFRCELLNVEVGANKTLLFRRETYEYYRVFSLFAIEALKETGQKRGAAPVVHESIASLHVIEMRADNNDGVRASRQSANDI